MAILAVTFQKTDEKDWSEKVAKEGHPWFSKKIVYFTINEYIKIEAINRPRKSKIQKDFSEAENQKKINKRDHLSCDIRKNERKVAILIVTFGKMKQK